MPFDAGILSFALREVNELAGGKVEKVYGPGKDEVVLALRSGGDTHRLLINAGSTFPRLCLTSTQTDNPPAPPMFVMLLRKHLTGARFAGAEQPGFERVAILAFDGYDELGFAARRYLIAEVMGKYSDLILTDADKRIMAATRLVDFSSSSKRKILPGMRWEMPPPQDKRNPLDETEESFAAVLAAAPADAPCDKFLSSGWLGISSLVARELSCRCCGSADGTVGECAQRLPAEFMRLSDALKKGTGIPTLVTNADGTPRDFSYMPILQYGTDAMLKTMPSFGALIDTFYSERAREERTRQRGADVLRLLSNAENRIAKKLALQEKELAECAEGDRFKLWGDLLTANIHSISRGDEVAKVTNWYSDDAETVEIPLDARLTPAANAQRYYKKYAKTKTARKILTEQIEIGKSELEYLRSVSDALSRTDAEADIAEIREELAAAGFASRLKQSQRKNAKTKPMRYRTDGGFEVICGKNNIQNDYITFKLAEKTDWWFHAKSAPGSHVVMITEGREPSEADFTQAANIAACNSSLADTPLAAVDYTLVKNIKKPSGSKPGFVIYHTNWSAYVRPDKDEAQRLRLSDK
jgi:predicted ribosome quality control (RQC) complex YloA/Tae2 family protein